MRIADAMYWSVCMAFRLCHLEDCFLVALAAV